MAFKLGQTWLARIWLNFMNIVFFDGTSVDVSWFVRIRYRVCASPLLTVLLLPAGLTKSAGSWLTPFSPTLWLAFFCRHLHSLLCGVFHSGFHTL